jgi:hypothetical protein
MSDSYADRLADLASDGLSSEQARTCAGKGISPRNLRPSWVCPWCGQTDWNCDCQPEDEEL